MLTVHKLCGFLERIFNECCDLAKDTILSGSLENLIDKIQACVAQIQSDDLIEIALYNVKSQPDCLYSLTFLFSKIEAQHNCDQLKVADFVNDAIPQTEQILSTSTFDLVREYQRVSSLANHSCFSIIHLPDDNLEKTLFQLGKLHDKLRKETTGLVGCWYGVNVDENNRRFILHRTDWENLEDWEKYQSSSIRQELLSEYEDCHFIIEEDACSFCTFLKV